jgi:1,2-diacylglycerol 3-alpha-glucosyltransferase
MFTDTYLPTIDGVVTSLVSTRKLLEKQGHEVFIFAPGDGTSRETNEDPNVIFFPGRPLRAYPDYRLPVLPYPVRSHVKRLGIELVHSHGMAFMGLRAVWVARWLHLPLVMTYHTRVDLATNYIAKSELGERTLARFIWTHLGWYFRRCDAVIAPTQATKDAILAERPTDIAKLYVVPNGVDYSRFAATDKSILAGLGIGADTPVVLSAGRIALEKRLETLIDAAPTIIGSLPGVRFVVAGRGPAKEHYEGLVKEAGLSDRFTFTGYIPDSQLGALYERADVFVMPSQFETQGMVALEAMHKGTPVVCASAGGLIDYVRHGENGYMFDPGDANGLARYAVEAYEHGDRVRSAAIETAKSYAIEGTTEKLLHIYDELRLVPEEERSGVGRVRRYKLLELIAGR